MFILDFAFFPGISLTPLRRSTEEEMFTSQSRIDTSSVVMYQSYTQYTFAIIINFDTNHYHFYFRAFLDPIKKKASTRRQTWFRYLHGVTLSVCECYDWGSVVGAVLCSVTLAPDRRNKECWAAASILAARGRAGSEHHSCIRPFHTL